jgi:hypothetical protein
MSPESRFAISPGVYARPFGDELVLLDFARGEYFGLDEMSASIWKLLEAGQSVGAIADVIIERFDVERDVAFADIVELVREMGEQGLVRPM